MKNRTGWLLAALLGVLAACANLLGPRQVEVPLATLQASLDKKFPFNNRYLELFDIRLGSPRLSLQPGTNRLVTTLDAGIAPSFLKKSWQGNLALSGVLTIDPVRQAVVLADPRVESFQVDGVEPTYAPHIRKLGGVLVEQLFRDLPLYRFHPDDFRYAGTSFLPTKINTTSNGLVVTFEPAR
jgi:hypothetical protein